ncbi:hypothetical protein SK128_018850 [Halocaridina rubra]|uniref:Uncharacterized protein n=1 Tax=Halocaridina rubra TaxID=373956 RepID=A0AAN8X1W1_HALRR
MPSNFEAVPDDEGTSTTAAEPNEFVASTSTTAPDDPAPTSPASGTTQSYLLVKNTATKFRERNGHLWSTEPLSGTTIRTRHNLMPAMDMSSMS